MTSSDFPSEIPQEEFVDEEGMIPNSALKTDENPQEIPHDDEGSLICDHVREHDLQDQLPDVESYKAMMGYRTGSCKKSGILKEKIRNKFAKKMLGSPIELTDSSDGSAMSGEDPPLLLTCRGLDPPGQHDGGEHQGYGDLVSDPTGSTEFMDDHNEEEGGCHDRNLVLENEESRWFWKCCTLITVGALLGAISFAVIAMTSHVNQWSDGDNHNNDLPTGDFAKGDTKEYKKVRNYLLNIGKLPYNRTYDNYDPDDIQALPTIAEPQPLVKQELLLDRNSPQYMAAQWLAHGDASYMSVPTLNQKEYNQRYAMATIYFALNGEGWTRNYNFLSSGHICTWKEEYSLQAIAEAATSGSNANLADLVDIHGGNWRFADGSSNEQMVIHGVHDCVRDADGNLYPKALYLPHNNLHGSIPDEIGILNELELLNIEFNAMVSGKLTGRLQELQYIRHLGLQFCNHEGHIPMWLPNLRQLEFLGLGSNRFDGNIPTDIALLTNLKLLGLDNNLVHGDLGMFAPLINLESLYLQGTFIDGGIESIYMELWPKLVELDVSSCDLTGTIPADFWNFVYPKLKVLDLHGNNLNGPIPSPPPHNVISGEPWELHYLALNHNQFTGMTPDGLSHFRKLNHLDISENGLSAELPPTFSELTNLIYFIAGNNMFHPAEFPKFLIELTELQELSFGGANLIGTIPVFLQYLSNLEVLDLHKNELSGTVPTNIASLTKLRHLVLKDNHLTGDFPAHLSDLTNLEVLLVEQNHFHGSADAVCDSGRIQNFVADCGAPDEGESDRERSGSGNDDGDWVVDNFQSSGQPGHGRRNNENVVSTRAGEVGDLIGGGNFPPSKQEDLIENNVDNLSPTRDGHVGDFIGGGNFTPSDETDSIEGNVGISFPTRDGHVGDMIGGNSFPPLERTGTITCSCCSMCCDPGDNSCHNWVRKGSSDTIWKYGKKKRYSYHL